jgi:hypothetical protein
VRPNYIVAGAGAGTLTPTGVVIVQQAVVQAEIDWSFVDVTTTQASSHREPDEVTAARIRRTGGRAS